MSDAHVYWPAIIYGAFSNTVSDTDYRELAREARTWDRAGYLDIKKLADAIDALLAERDELLLQNTAAFQREAENAKIKDEWRAELDSTRERVAKLVEIFRAQQKQAEVDTGRALKLNDDAKYWAACGRQSAYRHAIELLKEQP